MTQRHRAADAIWNGGASNPRGVARALVVDVDMGGVTDEEVAKAVVEKWYNNDDLHIERDLIDDEDNDKYAFVESVCVYYNEG